MFPTNDPEGFLTTNEVREKLRVQSLPAFWRLVHKEGLPHIRFNGRVFRYRWSDIQQWMQARSHGESH